MHSVSYRITFTEECLGTSPANPEIYSEYIASNRPEGSDPAEVAALPTLQEEIQKSMTVFGREGDKPILWDYQIRGFFKDACSSLARVKSDAKDGYSTLSSKLPAYKKVIDGLIFVEPRKIILNLPAGRDIGICERPLRAQTAQGERIALSRSETVPAGTWFDIKVVMMHEPHAKLVTEWLEHGAFRGLGQWRNSGKGKFSFAKV